LKIGARRIVLIAAVTCAAAAGAALPLIATKVPLLPGIGGCRMLKDAVGDRADCVAHRTTRVVEADGMTVGLREVEQAARNHATIADICHEAMHRSAAEWSMPKDGLERLLADSAVLDAGDCAPGFAHGVLQRVVVTGDEDQLLSAAALCRSRDSRALEEASGQSTEFGSACPHGYGHGLRQRLGQDRAVDACGESFPDRWQRGSCLHGVFMETTWQEPDLTLKEAGASCEKVTAQTLDPELREDVAVACWAYVTQRGVTDRIPPPGLAKACMRATNPAARTECLRMVGHGLPLQEAALCTDLTPADAAADCLGGLFRFAVVQARRTTAEDVAEWCLGHEIETACIQQLAFVLHADRELDDDQAVARCEKLFADEQAQTCATAIRSIPEQDRERLRKPMGDAVA
jgi:hypothetical protein